MLRHPADIICEENMCNASADVCVCRCSSPCTSATTTSTSARFPSRRRRCAEMWWSSAKSPERATATSLRCGEARVSFQRSIQTFWSLLPWDHIIIITRLYSASLTNQSAWLETGSGCWRCCSDGGSRGGRSATSCITRELQDGSQVREAVRVCVWEASEKQHLHDQNKLCDIWFVRRNFKLMLLMWKVLVSSEVA